MLTTKILYETSKKEGDLQNIKNKNKKQIYKKNKKIEEENIKINNKINKKIYLLHHMILLLKEKMI